MRSDSLIELIYNIVVKLMVVDFSNIEIWSEENFEIINHSII